MLHRRTAAALAIGAVTAADVAAEAALRERVKNSPEMRQITYANAVGVTQAYAGAWTVYKGVTKPTASTGLLKITVAGAGWTPVSR